MRKFRMLLIIIAALQLSGCAVNEYAEFYQPSTAPHLADGIAVFTGTPQVFSSSGNLNEDTARLFVDGYGPIGQASFNGSLGSRENAVKQAIAVHASHVVLWSKYQSTETGVMPVSTPTSSTAYISGTINGSPYSGTTRLVTTQTTYIPYAVQRFDQVANFYAPLPRIGFGVMFSDMPNELRQKIGSNYGRYVIAVRNESPAFKANIVPSDVIMSINDKMISSDAEAVALIAAAIGKSIKITYWRLGEVKSVTIVLPASW